jgi:hypothetical protein
LIYERYHNRNKYAAHPEDRSLIVTLKERKFATIALTGILCIGWLYETAQYVMSEKHELYTILKLAAYSVSWVMYTNVYPTCLTHLPFLGIKSLSPSYWP